MADIEMVEAIEIFVDAPTITAAREAIGVYLTQASSTNALTITGSGPLTFSTGAYTVTVPATGTMVLSDSTATLTNKTYDTAGAGNSFLINGLAATANTGTGSVVRATSPTLETPTLGDANCTTINGVSIQSGGTLTLNSQSFTITGGNLTFTLTGATGVTLPTAGTLATLAGVEVFTNKTLTSPNITTAVLPTTDGASNLGSTSKRWLNQYMATGGTINFNNGNWVATHSSDVLTVGTGDLRVATAGTHGLSVVTASGTQSLQNKTLISPQVQGTATFNDAAVFDGDVTMNSLVTVTGSSIFLPLTVCAGLSSSDGIGYAVGAGGSVTQLASGNKSTPVTINTVSGEITMHSAALADATNVTFDVNNSSCGTNTNIIVNVKSGATSGAYQVNAHSIGSGVFRITLRNVSGGSLAEAVVLHFSLIGGASS